MILEIIDKLLKGIKQAIKEEMKEYPSDKHDIMETLCYSEWAIREIKEEMKQKDKIIIKIKKLLEK